MEISFLFKYIEEIDFDSNAIGGTIPSWLGDLRLLKRLLDLDSLVQYQSLSMTRHP